MSIDEPTDKSANVNLNTNTQLSLESNTSTVNGAQPSATRDLNLNNNNDLSNHSVSTSSTGIKPPATVPLAGSDIFNANNTNSAKSSVQAVSANASSAAKAATGGENLKNTESLKEKKKKLTLALNVSQSPLSEPSSMSSCDSNKPSQSMDLKINNSTPNVDLVKYLDNHNTTTPCLDKLIFDFNSGNGLAMKTPASATLNYLTPNGTFPGLPSMQTQFSYSGINIYNMGEFKTPSEENSLIAVSLANPNHNSNSFTSSNNINNNNSNNTSSNSSHNTDSSNHYQRQNSEMNAIYVNPNDIFNNNNNNNNNTHEANNIPKYTPLVNIPEINGNSLLIAENSNNIPLKLSTHNVTGNYILVENVSNNKIVSSSSQDQTQSNVNNNFNIMTNATNKLNKDEFQTVPEHPPISNKAKPPAKRKANNTAGNKTKQAKLNSLSTDSSVESLNNQSSGSIVNRRDTGNSSIDSSNLDAYSPINMDNQARMKIEIKRERNREAARKCRTRKLEKIAQLEIQVKNLSAANELERAKNETLAEEILEIRQKLEVHKKVHNCDLKMI